jgi:hypothetical protein
MEATMHNIMHIKQNMMTLFSGKGLAEPAATILERH